MTNHVKLTQARNGRALYVPPPFVVEDLGDWESSSARAGQEARAAVLWGKHWFRVTETAEDVMELLAKVQAAG